MDSSSARLFIRCRFYLRFAVGGGGQPAFSSRDSVEASASSTPDFNDRKWNFPSRRTSIKPADSSSFTWCEIVAGEIGIAARTSAQPRGQVFLAMRSSSSKRRGSASAFNSAVRRVLESRVDFVALAEVVVMPRNPSYMDAGAEAEET